MPEAISLHDYGTYEIRVAPSLPTRIYMISSATRLPVTLLNSMSFYRSDNRGRTWFVKKTNIGATSSATDKLYGYKMAVYHNNPDIVYFGDSAGVIYRTTDGGTTWAIIGSVAFRNYHGYGYESHRIQQRTQS